MFQKCNPLSKLKPYLYNGVIITVGGRIRCAHVSYDVKQIVLLTRNSRMSVEHVHHNSGHLGRESACWLV